MIENNHIRRLVFAILTIGLSFVITSWIGYNAEVDKILVFLLTALAIMLGYGYGVYTMIAKYNRQLKDAIKNMNERG
jgi:hypothetical protein